MNLTVEKIINYSAVNVILIQDVRSHIQVTYRLRRVVLMNFQSEHSTVFSKAGRI